MASDDPLPSLIREMVMDEVSEKAECMYLLVGLYALRYLRILFFSHALIYCPSTSHHMKFENLIMMVTVV